jgi:hypothetical protein
MSEERRGGEVRWLWEGDDVNVSEWSLGAAGVLDVVQAALLFARYCPSLHARW